MAYPIMFKYIKFLSMLLFVSAIGSCALSSDTTRLESSCRLLLNADERLLEVSDIDVSDLPSILSNWPTATQPGCAKIDLNNDGALDVSIILVKRDTNAVFFRVYLNNVDRYRSSSEYVLVKEISLGPHTNSVFLITTKTRPKQSFAIPEQDKANMPSAEVPIFRLVFFEKASVDYFWDQETGRVISAQSSD